MEMSEIVSCPGGEQFRKRDRAQCGMQTAEPKFLGCKVQTTQLEKIFGPELGEFVQ